MLTCTVCIVVALMCLYTVMYIFVRAISTEFCVFLFMSIKVLIILGSNTILVKAMHLFSRANTRRLEGSSIIVLNSCSVCQTSCLMKLHTKCK